MRREERWWASGTAVVVWIALGTVAVHVATGWRYGFDRDELMALEDARHLAWGYVQYPPMTAFFGKVALGLFGTSLVGFRLFAALAQTVAVMLTGLMAKEIWRAVARGEWRVMSGRESQDEEVKERKSERVKESEEPKTHMQNRHVGHPAEEDPASTGMSACGAQGERWAMVLAALAGVPFCLGAGALMQYISFDYVCWVFVAWCVVKIAVASDEWRVASRREKRREEVKEYNSERGEESEEPKQIENGKWKMENEGGKGAGIKASARTAGERWWVGVGVGVGLGMMAKYTMLFLVCGVVAGVLLTDLRRQLRSWWLWLGVVVALGIFAPNFVWEWKRNFVSLDFLRFIHVRDVGEGLTDWFLFGQLEVTLLAAPLVVAGLWFCLFAEEGKRWRILGWMYLVPLVLFVVLRGRDYYLAPGYPMLYAAGVVWVGRKWRVAGGEWREKRGEEVEEYRSLSVQELEDPETRPQKTRMGHPEVGDRRGIPHSADAVRNDGSLGVWVRRVIWVALILDVVVAGAVALPVAPVGSRWWNFASRVDSVFPEEIGWPEFVEAVAAVRDRLPEEERARVGILAGNYGEVGALNLYGERFELPRAISGVNSSWERGFGKPAPEVVIVVGYSREFLEREFTSCVVGGRTWNRYGVMNEETVEDPEIFVCRGLKGSWEEFWKRARKFA